MKYLIAFVFLALSVSSSLGWELRTVDGKIQFAKYKYGNLTVWTDRERDNIIAKSSTATLSDFTDIAPDAGTIDIVSEVSSGNTGFSRTNAESEIAKRKSATYIEDQIVEQEELKRRAIIRQDNLGKNVDTELEEINQRIQVLTQRLQP